jgi:hypothetical protein
MRSSWNGGDGSEQAAAPRVAGGAEDTAACCLCGAIRARRRRWCSTAHDRTFALFKGTCGRGIYDNMKTAVETIFGGKDLLAQIETALDLLEESGETADWQ